MDAFLNRWHGALSARRSSRSLSLCMSDEKPKGPESGDLPSSSDPYGAVRRYNRTERGKEARRRAAKAYRDRNKGDLRAYDKSPERRAANAAQTKARRARDRGLRTLLILVLIYDGLFFEISEMLTIAAESSNPVDRAMAVGLSDGALDSPLFVRRRVLWLWLRLGRRVDRRYTPAIENPNARTSRTRRSPKPSNTSGRLSKICAG
jgi:hypothetical protein